MLQYWHDFGEMPMWSFGPLWEIGPLPRQALAWGHEEPRPLEQRGGPGRPWRARSGTEAGWKSRD